MIKIMQEDALESNYIEKAESLYSDTKKLIDNLRSFYMELEGNKTAVQEISGTLASISDISKNIKYWSDKTLRIGYTSDGSMKK